MAVCGSCNTDMRVCATCGGVMCTDGCIDRIDDGCTCEEEDVKVKDADDDEEEEDE